MIRGMTKKIGVSLPEDLYDWAAGQVREGRAESVSALIAEGLALLEARALLFTKVVDDLPADLGEPDDERKSRVEEALRAAEEAQRRHRAGSTEHAA